MIEVHPPEGPIHSRKEFLLHIVTITIGLLIALALENAAEWVHHVHQRHEADANIAAELRDNEKNLNDVLLEAPKENQNLVRAVHFLNDRIANKKSDVSDISLGLHIASLRDASWQTANANQSLSYMEYGHVKRYAAAYALQAQFQELQKDTLTAFLTVQSNVPPDSDPTQLSPADAERAKVEVQQALARIVAIQQIGNTLQTVYVKALEAE